jgi:hypothetical protein
MSTANGKYKYDMMIGNYELRRLVQMTHAYNCKQNGWAAVPLKEGSFGFDNLAVCIGYAIETPFDTEDLESLADVVHKAWIINYTYWRDNKPWLKGGMYGKPSKLPGDERRNTLAKLPYSDLPADEQEKDRIIARFIASHLL